jgi:hypothetical protein
VKAPNVAGARRWFARRGCCCGLTFELRRPARRGALGPRRTMEPATALRGPRCHASRGRLSSEGLGLMQCSPWRGEDLGLLGFVLLLSQGTAVE